MEEVRWAETDPQGRHVVLKSSTFDEHIRGDHDDVDAEIRIKNEEHAKRELAHPHLVILDPEDHDRHIYYRIILANNGDPLKKLKNLRVVVDTDREPNEVVTWIIERKMKGSAKKEWVVYDVGGINVQRLSGE